MLSVTTITSKSAAVSRIAFAASGSDPIQGCDGPATGPALGKPSLDSAARISPTGERFTVCAVVARWPCSSTAVRVR
jgi:hypothetical protein